MWRDEVEIALHILRDRMADTPLPSIRTLDLLNKVLAPHESVSFMSMVKQDIDGKVRDDLPMMLLCVTEFYCYLLSENEVQRHSLDLFGQYKKKPRRGETVITWQRVGGLKPLMFVLPSDLERSLASFMATEFKRMVTDQGGGSMTLSLLHQALQKVHLACIDVTKIESVNKIVTPEQLYVDAMILSYQEVVSMVYEACELPLKAGVVSPKVPILSRAGGMIARTLREAVQPTSTNLSRGNDVAIEITMNRTYADDRSYLQPTYWHYVRHLAGLSNPEPWNVLVKSICDVFLLTSIYRPPGWTMDDVDDKRFLPHREAEVFARNWFILTPEKTKTFAISEMLE